MKLSIISDDKSAYKDKQAFEIDDISYIPENVHALQFDDIKNVGHIEYKNLPNEEITVLPDWAIVAFKKFDDELISYEAKITANQITNFDKCKLKAQSLLNDTDWSVLPDVNLVNSEDFVTYRDILRKLVINPVENPEFPVKPKAIWE
jgi:hypothetical protein